MLNNSALTKSLKVSLRDLRTLSQHKYKALLDLLIYMYIYIIYIYILYITLYILYNIYIIYIYNIYIINIYIIYIYIYIYMKL